MSSLSRVFRPAIARLTGYSISLFARVVTAVRPIWDGIAPVPTQRVYFANHTSNGDFILVWTVMPPRIRAATRPVAASDYWLKNRLREFIARDVIHAVLIDRRRDQRNDEPMEAILGALDEGSSLIIFPEGRRNESDDPLLPFKSGLFNIASARPEIDLVPVWIENLNHVLPRGKVVPIPLLCTVTFGAPIRLEDGESREAFLARTAAALLSLARPGDAEIASA